jgi:hypothetical protein
MIRRMHALRTIPFLIRNLHNISNCVPQRDALSRLAWSPSHMEPPSSRPPCHPSSCLLANDLRGNATCNLQPWMNHPEEPSITEQVSQLSLRVELAIQADRARLNKLVHDIPEIMPPLCLATVPNASEQYTWAQDYVCL